MIAITERRLKILSRLNIESGVDRKTLARELNGDDAAVLSAGDQASLQGMAEMGLLTVSREMYRRGLYRYLYRLTEKGHRLLELLLND